MFGSSIELDAQSLHIESLQNRADHQGRQYQGSAQITVGYGVSGSGDFSHSQIRADHASVAKQSGLFAGDGGYRVSVRQHTDLKGGLITSTAKAEAENRNRFQTATLAHSDIQNHSRYSGTGFGIGAAGGFNADLGLGSHTAPQSSLTTTGAASAQSSQAIGFGRDSDKVLEIGFGMGVATVEIAKRLPQKDFLAIDVHGPGVGNLLKLMEEENVNNIRVMRHDAVEVVENMLADGSLDGIHIFFPDPWHKKRHHKRRLIQPPLVALLASRLQPGGYVHCATDWEEYAQQMLAVLSAEPLLESTAAAFAPRPDYRPLTKFENRGIKLGHGVWDVVFTRV